MNIATNVTMFCSLKLNRNICQKLFFENSSVSQLQAYFVHSGARSNAVRPLKMTSLNNKQRRPRSWTDNKESLSLLRQNRWVLPEEDQSKPLDDIANSISKYSSKYAAHIAELEHTRKLARNMRFIKFKTIESNYFKKPPSLNLLTWMAKEQIQYLHHTDSQTWTVQTLSELYPVSEDDIKNVIKSKIRLFREKDILEHDLTVQRNWVDLKIILESEGDCTKDVCQTFRNSANEIIIENAAGVGNLPFPVKRIERFNPKGSFSAIVTDCYVAKDQVRKKAEEELRHQTEQLCAMLSEISKIFDLRAKKETSRIHPVKSENVRNETIVSGISDSDRMSAEENVEVSGNIKNDKNGKENMEEFISSKYKDNPWLNHPEGSGNRKRDVPHKLKVPKDKSSGGEMFVSGDCVYDKDGEFLYRIL